MKKSKKQKELKEPIVIEEANFPDTPDGRENKAIFTQIVERYITRVMKEKKKNSV